MRAGFDRIGLWYAIPEGRKERDYGLWLYSNAEELREVLIRIRDEIIDHDQRRSLDAERERLNAHAGVQIRAAHQRLGGCGAADARRVGAAAAA